MCIRDRVIFRVGMHTVGHRATVHAKAHGKVAILYSGQLSGPERAELRPRPAEADTARRVAAGADERQLTFVAFAQDVYKRQAFMCVSIVA